MGKRRAIEEMAETACLVRSFSNPADVSREAKEGDPIRALTESVSFGRFMSESLAWEKWSTFSHNRYLEEVENFSKPGSVAQKKAYFEAHYKRRAAMRAAALLEQANTVIDDASQTGTSSAMLTDSSLITDAANENPSVIMEEEQEKDVSDAEVVNCADVDAGNLNVERDDVDVTVLDKSQVVTDQDVDMENSTHVEDSKAVEDSDNHGMIMAIPDKNIPRECTDQKVSTSSSKKRRTHSLSKPPIPGRASELPLHPSKRMASAQTRRDTVVAKSTENSNDKKKTTPNFLHKSIKFASDGSKTSKTSLRIPKDTSPLRTPTRAFKKATDQENLAPSSEKRQSNSTSKSSSGVSIQKTSRIGNNHANKNSAVDSNGQRRVVKKSLHMSMNFAPHVGKTNKTSPKISRDSSTALQTPARASVNGGSRQVSRILHSQDKRTRAVLNKSVSGGVTGDGIWPSLSSCLKSSRASLTSTQSPITSSPFRYRSEERDAKRKEFFKKLEDKMNSEAEKSEIQLRPKEKAKNGINKLRQSTDFKGKARPNEDLCHGSQPSHNNIKIPSNRPQSPKFGRKPPRSIVQDATSRPPRPSINTESSKRVLMKNDRIACTVTSLPKNRHENASPKIQVSAGKESHLRREQAGSVV